MAHYPDVAQTGLDPALHYLKYGAMLGRDPSAAFETKFYLETYPDIAASGVNPLVHYLTQGHAESRHPRREDHQRHQGLVQLERLRDNLLNLGFDAAPLDDLTRLADTAATADVRALAVLELALYDLRHGGAAEAERALARLSAVREDLPDQAQLTSVMLLAMDRLQQATRARAFFDYARQRGHAGPDAGLVMANFEPSPEARLACINAVLEAADIAPLALQPGADSAYDRLSVPGIAVKPQDAGPLVSVLVAAFNAAATLPTCLRALQAQSWGNLEILVIDDASTDDTAAVADVFAAADPRIKVLRSPVNAGAYPARNLGLAVATGEFVTLHDADDWSHPLRIESQLRQLQAQPDLIACTSQQARMTPDLYFRRWTGCGNLIIANTSSLMFRREPVLDRLGGWDAVRVSADSEMIRRMQRVFGAEAVAHLPTGPLALQRDTAGSAVRNPVTGIQGYLFGARREYHDAQRRYHAGADSLRYDVQQKIRPFPAPAALLPERPKAATLPLILAGDFRSPGPAAESACALCEAGRLPGIVELFRYDPGLGDCGLTPELRQRVNAGQARVLCFGEELRCDRLVICDPRVLEWPQRYQPALQAGQLIVFVPAPEAICDPCPDEAALQARFGVRPLWWAADPATAAALTRHDINVAQTGPLTDRI
ncbi:hypothetical protein CKO11_06720 [Rhodobacter sp. TJ_12]|uniref:glycosyltransferase family 2 protein n=1 Tax=Rhodobacter sp. TJ_12 TaxID=2029399 RepID=UPI001CBDD76D|nr:glycosyltransferase family A protein [Rhodobacter sp. TJ_12]MBZ4022150.1 hypothetical protein [Rhodobacter sp. TJ_12]